MRYYGIISDIHGNLPALQAALDCLRSNNVEKIIVLGDLVGYGAEPVACIDIVRGMKNAVVISGNHDRCVAGELDLNLRDSAAEAIRWSRSVLTDEHVDYLRNLPTALLVDSLFFAVHGSLSDPDEYIITSRVAGKNLKLLSERFVTVRVAFFGHSHVPMLISEQGMKTGFRDPALTIDLNPRRHYLINPGAVGQPRDGDPRASIIVFDVFRWAVTFVRVPYDIERAQQAIRFAGLPEESAARLAVGL